ALLTAAALMAFAVVDPGKNASTVRVIMPLMVLLLVGTGGVISMLSPYTAEVFPTLLRGTGSGIAAGASKVGGILAPPVVVILLAITPGFRLLAIAAAIPVVISAVVLVLVGKETKNRALEELTTPDYPSAGIPSAIAVAEQ
ncbi:MAG: MFS transporter, partial [Gemmatimonadaceae bacterium]